MRSHNKHLIQSWKKMGSLGLLGSGLKHYGAGTHTSVQSNYTGRVLQLQHSRTLRDMWSLHVRIQ